MPNLQSNETVLKTLHERLDNRATKIAAGTLFVLGAVGLTACGSGAESHAAPKPAASHSAEATPTPTATAETEVMPAALEQAEDASFAEFLGLPLDQREKWCSWETRDMADVAKGWESQSHNPLDKLPVLNGHNTPQELLTAATYNYRAAYVAHQDASVVFDKDTSKKVLSCNYTNPTSPAFAERFTHLETMFDKKETGYPGNSFAQAGQILMQEVTGDVIQSSIVDGNETIVVPINVPESGPTVAALTTIKGLDYNNKPTYFVTIDYVD